MAQQGEALARLRKVVPTVSVGMLTADLLALGSELKVLESAGVDLLHVDVMDGCFCPALTVGPALIKAMRTPMLKDVHLMIQEPLGKIEAYVAAGADIVTIQVESTIHPHRVLQALGEMTNANDPARGIVRGIGLNPGTPVHAIESLLDELDLVLLLAVNPGWGGQKFIEAMQAKLETLRQMMYSTGRELLVAIDGGISRDNIGRVARLGPDIVVTGSAVFDGQAPAENARFMLDAVRNRVEG
jgi:ribulose-phosphate 3-epimerase